MEPSPAVFKRRLSRIAKGLAPLKARCSKQAHARIAKGDGSSGNALAIVMSDEVCRLGFRSIAITHLG
jgi:hypothetical protein